MFADRKQAGALLAEQLERFAPEHPVVLGLPRGGLAVGLEVAHALHAPLDILAVRKLGAPGNSEFAVGAIAETGAAVLDRASARRVGMTSSVLEATVTRETRELRRQVIHYRGGNPGLDVQGRTVIVVDDGLATGMTCLAAVRAARALGAAKVVVAVPVAAQQSVTLLAAEADEVVCHTVPRELLGVSYWYQDFSPLSDAEVLALLAQARSDRALAVTAGS
jgi:predicted phosphoribosyltransferase